MTGLLTVGDRVERHTDSFMSAILGRKGVVTRTSTAFLGSEQLIKVRWDGEEKETVGTFYAHKFRKLADSISVDQALAVLRAAGDVKFTPRFEPITVRLNGEYSATVFKNYVKVGCQTFEFDAIDRLYVAVQKVGMAAK